MSGYKNLSALEIRGIITGQWLWKKCLICEGTGWQNWNTNTGEDIKHGKADHLNRLDDYCEICDGIGFVPSVEFDEDAVK